jgi:hypothetical protein
VGIVAEAGTADVADAELHAVDDEPVQVLAVPAERGLHDGVQTGDRGVGPDGRRRQISGLTPCTRTRSWQTVGDAGFVLSGMTLILTPCRPAVNSQFTANPPTLA